MGSSWERSGYDGRSGDPVELADSGHHNVEDDTRASRPIAARSACSRRLADGWVDREARCVPATGSCALWGPGHDPDLLDGRADGVVLEPGRGSRAVPARSGSGAGGPELGVPAAVRGAALDPGARRRRASSRAAADPDAVPRRAHALVPTAR